MLNQRMAHLGLTQFDLASKSGVSIATIRELLHAKPRQRSPRTLSAMSEALGWPSGQIAKVVQGTTSPMTEPQSSTDSDAEAPDQPSEAYLAVAKEIDSMHADFQRLEERLAEEVQELHRAIDPDRQNSDAAIDELREDTAVLKRQLATLQNHLVELYARLGQPYPHETTASSERKRRARGA